MRGSRIDDGGLFRCCVQSIHDDDGPDEIGRTLHCTWCDAPLVVVEHRGRPMWAWDSAALPSLKCIGESIRHPEGLDA